MKILYVFIFIFLIVSSFFLINSGCSRLKPAPDYDDYYPNPSDTHQNPPANQPPPSQTTPTQPQQPVTQPYPGNTGQVTGPAEFGRASYYADKFQGRSTSSGEAYDRNKLTCAHRTLPYGTMCKVTNTANGKTVVVRVNDRGPHTQNRLIDVSYKAMEALDGIRAGIINVKVEVLK